MQYRERVRGVSQEHARLVLRHRVELAHVFFFEEFHCVEGCLVDVVVVDLDDVWMVEVGESVKFVLEV